VGIQTHYNRTLQALALLMLISCGVGSSPYASKRIIESENELEQISSFVVLGQTTANQIIEELGQPAFGQSTSNGSQMMFYVWESTAFVLDEGDSAFGLFSPQVLDVPPGQAKEAYIMFEYDASGVAAQKHLQGPN
jgi:hypothetical protein